MERRLLIRLLLGGSVVAFSGIVGLWRGTMIESKPRRDFETFFPEPIYVDNVGWKGFLNRWNNEIVALTEELLLRVGLEESIGEKGLQNRLTESNVLLPVEVFSGKANCPPLTETEHSEAKRRLRLMRDAIPKIKRSIPTWPMVFEWEVLTNGGLHYSRASHEMIEQTEHHLSITLPRSYRDFLSVSNGWLAYEDNFLPIEQVGYLQDKDPDLVTDWYGGRARNVSDEKYFRYDLSKQYPTHIRVQYLPNCLLLSEHYGVSSRWYLLNPAIRFEDGEWEVWRLETRIAGARRFRSFKAMMEWLYLGNIADLRSKIYELT